MKTHLITKTMEAKEARKIFKKYAPIMNDLFLKIANSSMIGNRNYYVCDLSYSQQQDLIMLGYTVEQMNQNCYKISW